ncbi:ABC transporter substrate-binding protein [Thermodesulfobacteriota bacterium]
MSKVTVIFSVVALFVVSLMGLPGVALGADPIVIGLPTALGKWFGKGAKESVTMAVEEINAAGGVNVGGTKRPFKLVTIDTRDSDPGVPTADSMMAVEKLILEKKPVAIVGAPNRSEVMLSAMELNAKYKIPQLATLAKSPAFQKKVAENYEKYKYVFRLTESVLSLVKYHVDYIQHLGKEHGFKKIFAIYQDTATGKIASKVILGMLMKSGWEVVGKEAVPLGTNDFSIPLQKVKKSGAQVMLILGDSDEVVVLIDQWATMRVPAIPVGLAGPLLDRTLAKTLGSKVESVALHVCEAGSFPVQSIPKSVKFYNAYKKRWGHFPEGVGGQGPSYDSVYVLKAAIERAGTLDPDALVKALEATNMGGAIGHITFDKNHQAPFGYDGSKTAVGLMVQWQKGGKIATVFPLANAEAKTQLPAWMK